VRPAVIAAPDVFAVSTAPSGAPIVSSRSRTPGGVSSDWLSSVAEIDGATCAPCSGCIPPTSVAFKAPSAAEASCEAMFQLPSITQMRFDSSGSVPAHSDIPLRYGQGGAGGAPYPHCARRAYRSGAPTAQTSVHAE